MFEKLARGDRFTAPRTQVRRKPTPRILGSVVLRRILVKPDDDQMRNVDWIACKTFPEVEVPCICAESRVPCPRIDSTDGMLSGHSRMPQTQTLNTTANCDASPRLRYDQMVPVEGLKGLRQRLTWPTMPTIQTQAPPPSR